MNNTGSDWEVRRTLQCFTTLALSLVEMGKFPSLDSDFVQSLCVHNLRCSKKNG